MIAEQTNQASNETGEIVYKSGNRVVCSIDSSVNGFVFDYYTNGRRFRFNDILGDNRWQFVPVDSKCQVLFTDPTRETPEIQVPFYISKYFQIISDELFDTLAALHEIGHAVLYNISHAVIAESLETSGNTNLESRLSSTPLACIKKADNECPTALPKFQGNFREQMAETLQFFRKYFPSGEYGKFQERYAWAFAIWHVLQNGLLLDYDLEDFRQCYIPRLRSYGYDHVNWPNPGKFGKWLAGDPNPWTIRKEKRSWKESEEGNKKIQDFELLLREI